MKLRTSYRKIMQLAFVSIAAYIFVTLAPAFGQPNSQRTFPPNKPYLPKLSLVGDNGAYDKLFYPDGRLWIAPSKNGVREFLMPVFITNNWYDYSSNGKVRYQTNPIRSFKFSIFYDERAVRAVGVEQNMPEFAKDFVTTEPLAKNFHIEMDDAEDDNYRYYINPKQWQDNDEKKFGRRMTITGVTDSYLPNTDLNTEEYQILLWVRFRVIATNTPGDPLKFNNQTPIYIDPREVKYDDLNVATQHAYDGLLVNYDTTGYLLDYGVGPIDVEDYLAGISNLPIELGGSLPSPNKYNKEPALPGSITLSIFDEVPTFRFTQLAGDAELPVDDTRSQWELDRLLSVDENSSQNVATEVIKVANGTSLSRLTDIEVETDAEWLTIKRELIGDSKSFTVTNNGRNGFIRFIDRDILGGVDNDPLDQITQPDPDLYMRIICDPSKLPADPNGEVTGMHVGYITFKSPSADVSPVRIKVRFLYIKNPYEPDFNKTPGNPGGINLTMRNSKGSNGETVRLVFGTGLRATDGVDELYGETAYSTPLSTTNLDARWFPVPDNPNIPYGFGDITPSSDNARTNSRDIRNYILPDNVNSYTYLCKFNAGGADAYPIVISWDVSDFPEGSQLYIRDTQNGKQFQAVDMRKATGGGNVKTFTILDASITSFIIEYTPPQVIDFVDAQGNPIIKRGWNLLSLPLRPTNTTWNVVYPNAINVPWKFVSTQYQPEPNLKPGVGYFIKFPNVVDTKFAGARFASLTLQDSIVVYEGDVADPEYPDIKPGWNLIGALSSPTSIYGISFRAYKNGQIPSADRTRGWGVFGYETDHGYQQVSELLPGLGYWIKVDHNGYLELSKVSKLGAAEESFNRARVLATSTALNIYDNAQRSSKLYMSSNKNINVSNFELPPTPMNQIYDIRFSDNTMLSTSNESIIKVQDIQLPMSVTINKADADYTFIDPATHEFLGEIKAGTSGTVVINHLAYNAVKVTKQTVETSGFYATVNPNPVVESAVVNYGITEGTNVTINVYDELGNIVATLADGYMNQGEYSAVFNAQNLPQGAYLCKIQAGDNTKVIKLNVVK